MVWWLDVRLWCSLNFKLKKRESIQNLKPFDDYVSALYFHFVHFSQLLYQFLKYSISWKCIFDGVSDRSKSFITRNYSKNHWISIDEGRGHCQVGNCISSINKIRHEEYFSKVSYLLRTLIKGKWNEERTRKNRNF